MSESDEQQPVEGPTTFPKKGSRHSSGEPLTNDARRRYFAEVKAKVLAEEVRAMLAVYGGLDPVDFTLAGMLGLVAVVKNEITKAQRAADKELDSAKRVGHSMTVARLAKQQLDTLRAISKFQDTHSKSKSKGGNRSAAPGQQVSMSAPPAVQTVNGNGTEKPLCVPAPNSRF